MKKQFLCLALVSLATFVSSTGAQDCTVDFVYPAGVEAKLKAELSGSVSGFGPAPFGVVAPLMTTAPVADGVISVGEYSNVCTGFVYGDEENPGRPFPGLDKTATADGDVRNDFYLAHTDKYLFLGFDVKDTIYDLDEATAAFQNDSVELFINADINIDDFNADRAGRNSNLEGFQIVADAAGSTVADNNRYSAGSVPAPVTEPNPLGGEFYTAGKTKAGGWALEWMIPLATLDTGDDDNATVVAAKTGDVMLMQAIINDIDPTDENPGNNQGDGTHAMIWLVEDDQRSGWGGGENVWVVPLHLGPAAGGNTPGDLDGDGDVDDADFDAEGTAIRTGQTGAKFDLNSDGSVNKADFTHLVENIKKTYIGDSNLDLVFGSGDFVKVFTVGEYEDATNDNSGWADGDWNYDQDFDSGDFVEAFQAGGFELGPRAAVNGVPEPSTFVLTLLGLLSLIRMRRK